MRKLDSNCHHAAAGTAREKPIFLVTSYDSSAPQELAKMYGAAICFHGFVSYCTLQNLHKRKPPLPSLPHASRFIMEAT